MVSPKINEMYGVQKYKKGQVMGNQKFDKTTEAKI